MKKKTIAVLCLGLLAIPAAMGSAFTMTSFNGSFPFGGSFFPAYDVATALSADFSFTNYLAVTVGGEFSIYMNTADDGEPLAHPMAAGPLTADGSFTVILLGVPVDLKFKSVLSDFYWFGGAVVSFAVFAYGTSYSGSAEDYIDLGPYVNRFIVTPRIGVGWRFGPPMGLSKMFAVEGIVCYQALSLTQADALSRFGFRLALSMQVGFDELPFDFDFEYK